jgi:hypothetical protein
MVKARKLRNWGITAGVALLVPLALAACGETSPQDLLANAQAPCPQVSVLADAADLTRFRAGGGSDLTAMVVNASVAGFQAKCDYAPKREGLVVTLTPRFSAERGPAATGPVAEIPYMVAVVSDNDQVLSRASYTLRAEFPPNVARVRSAGEELSITLPGTIAEAATRRVMIGFILSPEELAANRRRGPR